MKIQIISDVHCDYHADGGISFADSLGNDSDVLVIAGDLCESQILLQSIKIFCDRFEKVIYVHGNHEYYCSNRQETIKKTNKALNENSNLVWLDNSRTNINGIDFVGSTLWFPDPEKSKSNLKKCIGDFSHISDIEKWIYKYHEDAKKILNSITENSVVITHHLPSYKSINKAFENHPINIFFAVDMEKVIYNNKPQLWIHGHTHTPVDYYISKTRVVCNSFGYVGYENHLNFNDSFYIDVKKC